MASRFIKFTAISYILGKVYLWYIGAGNGTLLSTIKSAVQGWRFFYVLAVFDGIRSLYRIIFHGPNENMMDQILINQNDEDDQNNDTDPSDEE